MSSLPTLPRRSWLERSSLALAVILVMLGAFAMVGWILRIDALVQPLANFAAFKFNNALCVLSLGLALLGLELGWTRVGMKNQ